MNEDGKTGKRDSAVAAVCNRRPSCSRPSTLDLRTLDLGLWTLDFFNSASALIRPSPPSLPPIDAPHLRAIVAAVPKTLRELLEEIERTKARAQQVIEESKRLVEQSKELMGDWPPKKKNESENPKDENPPPDEKPV